MPSDKNFVSLAAGEIVPNVLSGSIYERIVKPTRIIIAAKSTAALGASAGVNVGVNFGSRTMSQLSRTVANGGDLNVKVPDDVIIDDIAYPNEPLSVSLQNRNGAAGDTAVVMVGITELA